MAEQQKTSYTRLPGKGTRRGFFLLFSVRSTLWLANDHVLMVDSNGIYEDYRRFYFSDICSIVIMRTDAWKTRNYIMASAALVSLLMVLLAPFDGMMSPFFMILMIAFLIIFIVNTSLGPTCITRIVTAVQDEIVPSLGRVRNAEAVTAMIRRMCEKQQGVLQDSSDIPDESQGREPAPEQGLP